jgi:hypothetical protein
MTYREDESRLREPHLRENFAWLNRFTLSLLKRSRSRKYISKYAYLWIRANVSHWRAVSPSLGQGPAAALL